MPPKTSRFAGIVPNDFKDTIRGLDSNASRRYWIGIDQINWELKQLLVEAGWFADASTATGQLTIELRYTARHGVVLADSGWLQGRRKHYQVCVEANGFGLAQMPPHEERYWPLKRSCVQALCTATQAMGGSPAVLQRLEEALAATPVSPPWPAAPAFDLKLAAGFHDPVGADGRPADTGLARKDPLPDEPGTLWLTIEIPAAFSTASEDRVVEEIKDFMARSQLGEWDGDSSGGHELDVSFEVPSLQMAAKKLTAFMKKNFGTLEFRVGSECGPASDPRKGRSTSGR